MSVLKDVEREVEVAVARLMRMTITPLTIAVPEKVQQLARHEAQDIAYEHAEDSIGKYLRRKDAIPVFRMSATARRALRIEIDHEAEGAIVSDRDCPWRYEPWDQEGPKKLHDVSVYIVRNLPAPGWRVINPMEAT